MTIVRVDADACPASVRLCIEQQTRGKGLELVYYIDDSHELRPDYGTVQQVGQGHDAVDLALVNQIRPGDIVVSQDYGLAALALARGAAAIHPGGMLYTAFNIDRLLAERHHSAKARQAGERGRNPKKRARKDDENFEQAFAQLLHPRN